jgi:hypothetical protein
MLEFILALFTGWAAFESYTPYSFGSFILFFLLWIVYFIISRTICLAVMQSSKNKGAVVTNPELKLATSESIFGTYQYPNTREELINRAIKKNLLYIALEHPEIDFKHLWLLYEDALGRMDCDTASNYTKDIELETKIDFVIRATIITWEDKNPKLDDEFLQP